MAGMQFLTRGGTSPQGKPKVYFCCHPEDLVPYLEPITAELLEKQNCAVWYAQDIQPDLSDLEQMQLFVIPVTRRFLTSSNRAMEVEYPFAIANHIPVLPLMQEPGLEALFNQKCGQLQFLDKNASDTTGISYEEKLRKFLSAVLIGDKLSERIRNAFDAYMFLSYRKKDRLHAHRLMKLIHQNDFCRDIAIWYDEFLTPGENFNASIQHALEQSNLFVLTVTPNLVNETNYVMTTEYPMAWQAGKPIVPVELVSTDRTALMEKYIGIPSPADAQDPAELTRSLQAATTGLALRRKDSPEQDYLMGLAYLGGVDVEVDHTRARQLITASAEAGFQKAVEKLVDMYSNGAGVARNYETALHWQEHLVWLREQQYRQECTPTHLYQLAIALQDLGNQHVMLLRLPQAIEKHCCVIELLESFPKCQSYPKLQRTLAVSCLLLGHFYRETKELDTAKSYFEKALSIFKRLNKMSSAEEMVDAHQCQIALGDLCAQMGDQKEAQRLHKSAQFWGMYAAVTDDTGKSGRALVESMIREAERYENQGDLQKAEQILRKHMLSQLRLAEETKATVDQSVLSTIYINLARLRKKQNDLPEAEANYLKALEILSSLAERTDTIEARGNLAKMYVQLGLLRNCLGRSSEAQQAHESALTLYVRLAEESEKFRLPLADNYFYLGELHRLAKCWGYGEACYQQALQSYTVLSEEKRAVQARRGILLCYVGQAHQYRQTNQLEQAIVYFQKALSLGQCLPPDAERDRVLASHYEQLGYLYQATGQIELARKYYEAAFSIRMQQAKECQEPYIQEELGRSYAQMFIITKKRTYLEKAIEIFSMLCRICPNEKRYHNHLAMLKDRLSQM